MAKISVVGSLNADVAVRTARMPNDGETVVGDDIRVSPGGKGANQAIAAARLGGDVRMFGCVGDDGYGELLKDTLRREGVHAEFLKTISSVSTGTAVVIVTEKDNRIITVRGANACATAEYIDSVKNGLLDSDLVVLQHEIPFETVEYVIRLCHGENIPVILNPAPALPVRRELIDMVRYIVPNEHETAPVFQTEESLEGILLRFPEKLIVTLGKNGAAYCTGNRVVNVPAIRAKRIDSTGAGDTFLGAFAKAAADGAGLREAVVFAQYASGLSIEKFGAQAGMPTMREIDERRRKLENETAGDP